MRVTGLDLPPPSCLASVKTTRAEGDFRRKFVEQFISDERDAEALAWHRSLGRSDEWVSTRDELEVWRLGCSCGQERGKIFGISVDQALSAPLFHACPKCGLRALLFDPTLHGYNAETSKRKRKPRKVPPATVAMHCRGCKNTLWHPAVIVTYQGEPPQLPPDRQLQDLFDVFVIGGECASCGVFAVRYDAECA